MSPISADEGGGGGGGEEASDFRPAFHSLLFYIPYFCNDGLIFNFLTLTLMVFFVVVSIQREH